MFRTKGYPSEIDGHVNMSFRDTGNWLSYDGVAINTILMGDDEVGPNLGLIAVEPGVDVPAAESHAHASDNWRISIMGESWMGPQPYGPGEFRLQEGWKSYPGDKPSLGPLGGWHLVYMADRRGTKIRWAVKPDKTPDEELMLEQLAITFDYAGDIFSDDPAKGAGPSAIASTLVAPTYTRLRMNKLDGSYADSQNWEAVTDSTHAAVTLLGDRTNGPVMILTATEAGQCAAPTSRFGTEVFRLIIEGSCSIGPETYQVGDMRIQEAGAWCEPVLAGEHGLKEMILIGNRALLEAATAGEGWPSALPEILDRLNTALGMKALPTTGIH